MKEFQGIKGAFYLPVFFYGSIEDVLEKDYGLDKKIVRVGINVYTKDFYNKFNDAAWATCQLLKNKQSTTQSD